VESGTRQYSGYDEFITHNTLVALRADLDIFSIPKISISCRLPSLKFMFITFSDDTTVYVM
jgi:hypothetical protein